jgi:hypothetical protein
MGRAERQRKPARSRCGECLGSEDLPSCAKSSLLQVLGMLGMADPKTLFIPDFFGFFSFDSCACNRPTATHAPTQLRFRPNAIPLSHTTPNPPRTRLRLQRFRRGTSGCRRSRRAPRASTAWSTSCSCTRRCTTSRAARIPASTALTSTPGPPTSRECPVCDALEKCARGTPAPRPVAPSLTATSVRVPPSLLYGALPHPTPTTAASRRWSRCAWGASSSRA